MRKYYNNEKYYVRRAIKVAKHEKNQNAIDLLNMLLRKNSVYTINFVKEINDLKISNVNLFKLESKD